MNTKNSVDNDEQQLGDHYSQEEDTHDIDCIKRAGALQISRVPIKCNM